MQQGRLAQALAGQAQAGFPGGVQRDWGQVLVEHGQQVLRQLPGTVAFASAALDPFTQHLVELTQCLVGQALGMDVLQHPGKTHALVVDELALAAAEQPARFQPSGLGDAELDPIHAATFRAHGVLYRLAHLRQVVRVDAGVKHVEGHFGIDRQAEQGLAAVVPQQQPFLRAHVPGAHASSIDGNACTCLDVGQGFFGAASALALLNFGQGPAYGLGQQRQVLLQHIIGGAQADHFHRMFFAVDTRQEDERNIRCQALGNGQHFGAGRARQHAVAQDQVMAGLAQGLLDTGMVEHQLRLHIQPAAFQAHQGQLGVHRIVFDHQQFERCRQHRRRHLRCCHAGSGAASRVAVR